MLVLYGRVGKLAPPSRLYDELMVDPVTVLTPSVPLRVLPKSVFRWSKTSRVGILRKAKNVLPSVGWSATLHK